MIKFIDCTFRDGGYYNNWDFDSELVQAYLETMSAIEIDYVEIGFRSLSNNQFKGGFAFSTDNFISSLNIPDNLKDKIGVMVNASELIGDPLTKIKKIFKPKIESPVTLVRIASHVHEFEEILETTTWLKENGYKVGVNLMQIADRTPEEITQLAKLASNFPIDVFYFADSMGSLLPEDIKGIIDSIKKGWSKEIGIHTHDNMRNAVINSISAYENGVTWIDCTVTGMGRGPGNAQTENIISAIERHDKKIDNCKLFNLVTDYFKPMQRNFDWGTNHYYYLSGKYGIHPSYIQEMLSDKRYNNEDILSVINYLKEFGGKKFNRSTLDSAKTFYPGTPKGTFNPTEVFQNQEVLILGTGPSVLRHKVAIENFIKNRNIKVIALNTQNNIDQGLVNYRAACHPARFLSDLETHKKLPQPLFLPESMISESISKKLEEKQIYDFGIEIQNNKFQFHDTFVTVPKLLVFAYILGVVTCGKPKKIYLAGFDGFIDGDPRTSETNEIFLQYKDTAGSIDLVSITPTKYTLKEISVYGDIE